MILKSCPRGGLDAISSTRRSCSNRWCGGPGGLRRRGFPQGSPRHCRLAAGTEAAGGNHRGGHRDIVPRTGCFDHRRTVRQAGNRPGRCPRKQCRQHCPDPRVGLAVRADPGRAARTGPGFRTRPGCSSPSAPARQREKLLHPTTRRRARSSPSPLVCAGCSPW